MNARTPNTIAAMPRNNRSHQHLASACSIGRSGNERGISRAACIEISSSKHCRETTQISVPEELDYRPFSFKSTQEDNDVRFGSKADICSAKRHVRFTPNSDRERGLPQRVMSALPPKADMCTALAHVCFGPKADSRPHSIDQFISAAE